MKIFKKKSVFFLIILIGAYNVGNADMPINDQLKVCEEAWMNMSKMEENLSIDEMIKKWEKNKNLCSNTGFYEYKLGWLYIYAESYTKAQEIFDQGLKQTKDYTKELLLGLADIHFHKASRLGLEEEYVKAKEKYDDLINEYPKWYGGYEQMATLLLLREDFKGSIDYGERAIALKETALAYRNLSIAYQNIGQSQLCIDNMNKSYELDNALLGDKNLMLSAAISYAKLGKYELSRNSLAVLMQRFPGVDNSDEFKVVMEYVKNKIQKSKIKKIE